MPEFSYRASSRTGVLERGELTAPSREAALRELRSRGLTPVQVVNSLPGSVQNRTGASTTATDASGLSDDALIARIKREMVLGLTSELAVLVRAGLPIDRALRVQEEMSADPVYIQLVRALLAGVKSGKSLSAALEPYREAFGNFYVSMVRAGEASGHLGDVLHRLAEALQVDSERRRAVVSALIYPAVLAVVAVLSIAVMLGFVVPQFESLFSDMGDALPMMTVLVLGLGKVIQDYFLLVAVLTGMAVYLARRALRSPEGRRWLDERMISLPLFGEVVRKSAMAQFSRTLGTLLVNGVRIVTAIGIASDTIENSVLRAAMQDLPGAVKGGKPLSATMREHHAFSPMMVQMVRVGEESGRMGEMLLELARIYDAEVDSSVKRMLGLVEPALILVMGVIIAVLIVSILMGILAVNDLAL